MIYARRAEASVTVCLMHRSSPEPSPPRFSDRRDRVSFSCVGSNYHRGIEEIVLFLPIFFFFFFPSFSSFSSFHTFISPRKRPTWLGFVTVSSKREENKGRGGREENLKSDYVERRGKGRGREREGPSRRRRPDANSTTTMVTFYGSESSIACRSRSERQ